MTSIAFFNNKGGVGKTSLVYHLAWMFAEREYRVITADLDPQANLSSMFLNEEMLEGIWQDDGKKTIDADIMPLFDGSGDISSKPHIEEIGGRIGLLPGDMVLSRREDDLSAQWPKCSDGDSRAFRVTTAFARLLGYARKKFEADVVLIDVGPNLGAINRAALIASDYVVIPLAPDLFSLQGLRNVGPTLKAWKKQWQKRLQEKPQGMDIEMPVGDMQPLGYIVMRHTVRLSRPIKAYGRWIAKIPSEYRKSVLQETGSDAITVDTDDHALAHLRDYQSLMPLAQEANKPMFSLKPGDGVIGAQQRAVLSCYDDFHALCSKLIEKTG